MTCWTSPLSRDCHRLATPSRHDRPVRISLHAVCVVVNGALIREKLGLTSVNFLVFPKSKTQTAESFPSSLRVAACPTNEFRSWVLEVGLTSIYSSAGRGLLLCLPARHNTVDNNTIQCNLYLQHPKTDAGHYCVYKWFNETKWQRSVSGTDASVITKQFVGHAKMKCLTGRATVNKGVWSVAKKFVSKMQWLKSEVLRWGSWLYRPYSYIATCRTD